MPNPATESDGATRGQMQALIATALNQTGPYAHTRNPLYLGTGQATTKPYWPLFWEQAERPIITPQKRAAQTQQTARRWSAGVGAGVDYAGWVSVPALNELTMAPPKLEIMVIALRLLSSARAV